VTRVAWAILMAVEYNFTRSTSSLRICAAGLLQRPVQILRQSSARGAEFGKMWWRTLVETLETTRQGAALVWMNRKQLLAMVVLLVVTVDAHANLGIYENVVMPFARLDRSLLQPCSSIFLILVLFTLFLTFVQTLEMFWAQAPLEQGQDRPPSSPRSPRGLGGPAHGHARQKMIYRCLAAAGIATAVLLFFLGGLFVHHYFSGSDIDLNGDGKVSPEEQVLKAMDQDHDGKVSSYEWLASVCNGERRKAYRMFGEADRNGDGTVDSVELAMTKTILDLKTLSHSVSAGSMFFSSS